MPKKYLGRFLKNLYIKISEFKFPTKICILLGSEGIFLCIFHNNALVNTYHFQKFAEATEVLAILKDKYQKAKVCILLDDEGVVFKHVALPSLDISNYSKSIYYYIKNNYKDNELTAAKLLETTENNVIKCLLTNAVINEELDKIISFFTDWNSYESTELYFLPLELENLSKLTQKTLKFAEIEVKVIISKLLNIRILAYSQNDILFNKIIPYPPDKSMDFLNGTLEVEINEALNVIKNLITLDENSVAITIYSEIDFKKPQITFAGEINIEIINTTIIERASPYPNNLTPQANNTTEIFILKHLLHNKSYKAYNRVLQNAQSFERVKNLILKPSLVLLGIFYYYNFYLILTLLKANMNLDNAKNSIVNESLIYQKEKALHKNIKNFDQLLELVYIEEKFKKNNINALVLIKNFLNISEQYLLKNLIEMEKVKWSAPILDSEPVFSLEFKLKQLANNQPTQLNNYFYTLEKNFTNYNVHIFTSNEEINKKISNNYIKITIKNK